MLPLEGYEQFSLDGVHYEAFNTSGGLGTLCETLDGKVRELNYRTIRYFGHRDLMQFLLRDLRMNEKRDLLKQILEDAIPVTWQDVVITFVTVAGMRNGQFVQTSDARKVYHQQVGKQHWGAIQLTTAAGICGALDLYVHDRLSGFRFCTSGGHSVRRLHRQPFRTLLRRRYSVSHGSNRRLVVMNDLSSALLRLGVLPNTGGLLVGEHVCQCHGENLQVRSPIDGSVLWETASATADDLNTAVASAHAAFHDWRLVPAPLRGEFVRRFGILLREHQRDLATLITLEAGKIRAEAQGEVQEMIDICDFAVGLSRQLYGLTIATERPRHRMMEQWHPLGPVGIISAFNFPAAVWAWNSALALVCGNSLVWKPSEKTPLTAIASHTLLMKAAQGMSAVPAGISSVVVGGSSVGKAMAGDRRIPLISATGSVAMGKSVAQIAASRLGRTLLELGGNNACIVTPSADLELAVRAIVFAAVGTCGQRCTTLRRLIVHESIADRLLTRLKTAYASLPVGNPLEERTLIGPLIDSAARDQMQSALDEARHEGGTVFGGEPITADVPAGGCYVHPAIVEMPGHAEIMYQETFAPILYVVSYRELTEAIRLQNCVTQGLASSIFTTDLREAELFLSAAGSDCGIANVNIGPSGAEIGGAFGGEKETGGGRESGSDSWKNYMRRATNTINFGNDLPLAQGIRFG